MSRRAPPPAGPGLAPAPLRRSVDEAALNAKLRELREAMSKEKVAREGARARQAAGGGHIWASSRAWRTLAAMTDIKGLSISRGRGIETRDDRGRAREV